MAFFWSKLMKNKLKIILAIAAVTIMATALLLSSAFNINPAKIDSGYTGSSTYIVGDTSKAALIQETVSFEDDGIKAGTVLTRISENIEEEVEKIHKEYKAEVLGSNTAGSTASTVVAEAAPAEPSASLNDYESAVLHLINTIRASNGLGALQPSQKLTDIARSRCNDMIANSYFSHYTPDGRNIFNIFRENGVSYRNGGENLAQSSPASAGTPDAFANAWMSSPTHKANILRAEYTRIGIGISDGGNRRVVATVFTN